MVRLTGGCRERGKSRLACCIVAITGTTASPTSATVCVPVAPVIVVVVALIASTKEKVGQHVVCIGQEKG